MDGVLIVATDKHDRRVGSVGEFLERAYAISVGRAGYRRNLDAFAAASMQTRTDRIHVCDAPEQGQSLNDVAQTPTQIRIPRRVHIRRRIGPSVVLDRALGTGSV